MDRELFRQVKSARKFLALAVVSGLLVTFATIAQMTLLSEVVSRIFLGGQSLGRVEELILFLLGAVVVRAGLVWVREVVSQRGAILIKTELRERFFARLMKLGPAFTKNERTGELVSTAVEGVERLDAYFGRYLPQVALSALVPLSIFLYLMPVDWISGLLLLGTAPVVPILMIAVGKHAETHIQRQWRSLSRMSAYFLDTLQGLTTLKVFGLSASEGETVANVGERFRKKTLKVLRYAFVSGLVLEFTVSIAIAVVAVELGIRLLRGDIAFQPAFLVLLLAPEFYRPLRDLGVSRHAGMEGKAAAERIFEVLNTAAPTDASSSDAKVPVGSLDIELSRVSFTYPDAPRPALSGVSLTLPAGTTTALVGRSGAGKSTLVNLLLRFMESESGEIRANGVGISELAVEGWRERVALVPQRPYLFYGSVFENIRLARPEAGREEVERAAELAGAAGFIRRLPEGYETGIGERGARLSGGEAQRIAIARAFLKDAPLLILDEPTSSLDPESEKVVRRAVERLAEGRTTLIIAHRLNTIHDADRIAVLDAGRVEAVGTHAELVESNKLYAALVSAPERVAR